MLKEIIDGFYMENNENNIKEELAFSSHLIGMKIFDDPIFGVAKASDPIFELFSDEYEVMYNKFQKPNEWLDSAKTVVSIFLPYSVDVKIGNGENLRRPSLEWLHGRYEGQIFINKLSLFIKKKLEEKGLDCVVPSLDERYIVNIGTRNANEANKILLSNSDFWSNWSERHIAFSTGLGTFSLSKI